MYLSKQWRESRIVSILAILGLALLLALVVKGAMTANAHLHVTEGNHVGGMGAPFIPLFYVEAALVGFWAWLIAGIGIGKNLGEESGSFLLTRPRRRAWFMWSDWGYAMAQITAIIVLTNLMIGLLLAHMAHLIHRPGVVPLADSGATVSLFVMAVLVSAGVLLFAGLIYGITYLSTIITKRAIGVMLGLGIIVLYEITRGLVMHYFPSVQFPHLIMDLFNVGHRHFQGLSGNLAIEFIVRALVMIAFPVAAQLVLDRSEI